MSVLFITGGNLQWHSVHTKLHGKC